MEYKPHWVYNGTCASPHLRSSGGCIRAQCNPPQRNPGSSRKPFKRVRACVMRGGCKSGFRASWVCLHWPKFCHLNIIIFNNDFHFIWYGGFNKFQFRKAINTTFSLQKKHTTKYILSAIVLLSGQEAVLVGASLDVECTSRRLMSKTSCCILGIRSPWTGFTAGEAKSILKTAILHVSISLVSASLSSSLYSSFLVVVPFYFPICIRCTQKYSYSCGGRKYLIVDQGALKIEFGASAEIMTIIGSLIHLLICWS